MKIGIFSWVNDPSIVNDKVPGVSNADVIIGENEDAIRIASSFFELGLNVMLKHNFSRNIGTKKNPNMTEESITIFIDDKGFQVR